MKKKLISAVTAIMVMANTAVVLPYANAGAAAVSNVYAEMPLFSVSRAAAAVLDAGALTAGTFSSVTEVNSTFSITASTDKTVSVEAKKATASDGKAFTSVIKLGGTGKVDYRSVKITASSSGTLKVYMASSSKDTPRTVNLLGSGGNVVNTTENVVGDSVKSYNVSIPGAGTYYLASADSGLYVYYAELSETGDPGTTDPGTTDPGNTGTAASAVLEAGKLSDGTLSSLTEVNSMFSITASTDKTVTVDSAKKTTASDGKVFYGVIKLGGTGKVDYRSVKITAAGSGTLNVYMASSSKDAARTVNLLDSSGKAVKSVSNVVGDSVNKYSIGISGAGTYYLASEDSGLNIIYAEFVEGTPSDGPGTTTPGTTDPGTTDPGTTDPGTTDPGTTDPGGVTASNVLDAGKLTAGTLSAATAVNSAFSITASSDKTVSVEAKKASASDGKSLTGVIKLGGSGKVDYRSIQITASSSGSLKVYMASSSKDASRNVNLLSSSGKVLSTTENVVGDSINSYTINIPSAGKFYLASEDSSLYVYYAELTETGEPGTVDPGDVTPSTVLDAGKVTAGTHSSLVTVNSMYSITANSEKTVAVDDAKKSTASDGKALEGVIKLGGTGKVDYRSIKITAAGSGSIKIYMASSSKEAARTVNLLDGSGNVVKSVDNVVGDAINSYSMNIPSAGTYYLASDDSGLNIYYIEFSTSSVPEQTTASSAPGMTTTTTTTTTTDVTTSQPGQTTQSSADTTASAPQVTTVPGTVSASGDVNKDGKFNSQDISLLQKWLAKVPGVTLTDWKAGDLDNNNKLNVFDLVMMKRKLISGGETVITTTTKPAQTTTTTTTAKPSGAVPANAIVAAPNGSASGNGTEGSPYDIASALTKAKAGDQIYCAAGTYNLSSTIKITNSGTADKPIKVTSYNGNVILDFSKQSLGDSNRGVSMDGNYWHWYGITIRKAGDNGMILGGNNNVIEMCVFENNQDTGLQVSRISSNWPSNNLIKNCTSRNNCDDKTMENADGFAAKLTCGEGNVFDGCIAYNNSDDGWDLFAKTDSGPIGVVTIKNCVAFRNGYTEDGRGFGDCDGNGFKLGGSGVGTAHIVQNCIAFENLNCGFTDNNNPKLGSLTNCTAYNNGMGGNGKPNFSCYRCTNPGAAFKNCLAYTSSGKFSASFPGGESKYKSANDKFVGTMENSIYYNSKYYYQKSKTSIANGDKKGDTITPADNMFVSLNVPAYKSGYDFHTKWRNSDGSINMGGFLKVSPSSPYNGIGANLSK